jgi:NADPH-dependent 2,4-dienoyl-CoA reductase/sulfur reductase-like enzyme
MSRSVQYDVLIVGMGPAGIAAACAAAEGGRRTAIVDDNPAPGGQIWRGRLSEGDSPIFVPPPTNAARRCPVGAREPGQSPEDRQAAAWFRRLAAAGVECITGTQVVAQTDGNVLLAESGGVCRELAYDKLVLATGARESFVPFPGWTLPNVVGAGGLQALVTAGLPIAGKRVAVAGGGPLLFSVAAGLRQAGAKVILIAEQTCWSRLIRFGFALVRLAPGKLMQGLRYKWRLLGVPYRAGCWPVAAEGERQLERVTFRAGKKTWTEPCDYLACGFGLTPNTELPRLLGCRMEGGVVKVDPWQETSVPGVYCAGEPTGIGGVERALAEGQIAGHAAAGQPDRARRFFSTRARMRRFAGALNRAFALRDELRQLAAADTIVCRCEDVTRRQMASYTGWRPAKLHTRCGMGSCQGRVCGAAAQFLFGWEPDSVRPPIFPVSVESLAGVNGQE